MELIRSIKESLDLIHLFLGEEENSSTLKKWFSGDIVENRYARDAADKFVNRDPSIIGAQIAFKEAKAHMYRILSFYTHNTYTALLDSYDVYNKDFDFEKISGYDYVREGVLPFVHSTMEETIIALKHFYLVAKDETVYNKLDSILRESSPQHFQKEPDEETKKRLLKIFEQFRR
jgi:hypothetical protein